MEINELYIKNFGKFTDKHFLLHSGVHIFYGENEYGKSTIYAFIKAMLFGLERSRGRAAQNDEFSRYEPWDNPNYYAGMMKFSSGGKHFCLERTFDRYTKHASLVCEDDGEEFSLDDGDLDVLLGGITRENFENTVAIGQLTARPGQELADALKNYAANYYETGSNEVNLQGALEALKVRKKSLEQEIKELKNIRDEKRLNIHRKMEYVNGDIEKIRNELDSLQKKQKSIFKVEEETLESYLEVPKRINKWGIVGFVFMVLGLVCCIGTSVLSVLPIVGGVLCLIGILCLFKTYMDNKKKKGYDEKQVDYSSDSQLEQKLKWEIEHILAEYKEKKIEFENLQEALEEVDAPDEKWQLLERTKQALLLAEEKLIKASKDMSHGFGEVLNDKASQILQRITDGKYTKLFIDESLNIAVFHEGKRIRIEQVSRGTIEQIYFALRMAAMELMHEETLPIIADDAFVYYDENRLKLTIKWLSEKPRQVIIFTCQKREMKYSF